MEKDHDPAPETSLSWRPKRCAVCVGTVCVCKCVYLSCSLSGHLLQEAPRDCIIQPWPKLGQDPSLLSSTQLAPQATALTSLFCSLSSRQQRQEGGLYLISQCSSMEPDTTEAQSTGAGPLSFPIQDPPSPMWVLPVCLRVNGYITQLEDLAMLSPDTPLGSAKELCLFVYF